METIIGFFIFQLRVPVIFSRVLGSSNIKDETYKAWDAVFQHQMKHREESWKYNAQQSICDELWGSSSGDEILCWMLDITLKQNDFTWRN